MDPSTISSRIGLSDTSSEAQAVLDDVYRRMSIERKWTLLLQAQRRGRMLADVGKSLREGNNPAMSRAGEDSDVLRTVVAALDKLSIPYALGGSMASSIYGVMRTTQDANLTVEPFAGREQSLADCFGEAYYLSVPAMREANQRRSSFNIIDTSVGFKCDLFVRKDRPFEISAMSRRVAMCLPDRPDEPLYVHSPEDVVLFKLECYRLGGESSERQWLDVLNVIKAQADRLDREYLCHWADELSVSHLLTQAIEDAGIQ